ncbi:hypothetical protein DV736_g771, partial [Chaetothyriales sp. CBS 134916]
MAQLPREYILEVFADQSFVRDIVRAAIDAHTAALVSQLTSPSPGNVPPGGSRGEIVVRFFDRKRRKSAYTGGWLGRLGGGGQTEEEVCWEEWCLQVVVARPRSEADRIKVRRAMESSLQKTALKIVNIVNRDKDHIPPITTSEQNPFPYQAKKTTTAKSGFLVFK